MTEQARVTLKKDNLIIFKNTIQIEKENNLDFQKYDLDFQKKIKIKNKLVSTCQRFELQQLQVEFLSVGGTHLRHTLDQTLENNFI